jgi:hypothetical protein
MGRLLVALDPGAGVDPAVLAAAWNGDEAAAAAGVARVDAAGPREFIPGVVELVVVPLAVNLASSAVYDLVKRLVRGLRHDDQDQAEPELAETHADGDLIVVIRAGSAGS